MENKLKDNNVKEDILKRSEEVDRYLKTNMSCRLLHDLQMNHVLPPEYDNESDKDK